MGFFVNELKAELNENCSRGMIASLFTCLYNVIVGSSASIHAACSACPDGFGQGVLGGAGGAV
jgi:hypothetical protein